ncbi:MAG: T9SS type A sorting domain-containing protein, partial [Flavobacteriaceae bacterium]|nr:T9SS type A sorting domain-containing protein [Flavobacteriaceae bacterium]
TSDFRGNPNLNCIEVDNKSYSDTNWSNIKDETATYSEDCSATASVEEYTDDTILLYPNPTNGEINITNIVDQIKRIEIYNTIGKKLLTTKSTKINISSFPKGIYYLKIVSLNKKFTNKKVILK